MAKKKNKNTTPRKVNTGTSYQAKGLSDIAPPQLDVEFGSATAGNVRELVPDLVGFQRTVTYGKMLNDAGVDMSMRATKTPVLGAEFFIDPFSSDPLDVEIGEFISANLVGGMSAPLVNSLEDILHFYEDGYSVLEPVYEMREWSPKQAQSITRPGANTKQFTMLKKLGVRHPSTIKGILYDDNGGPLSIEQGAILGDNSTKDVTIDITKLMIFTFSRRGGDLQGKSLLRTAYQHWYYKNHFYKIDAIQKERNSLGVPKGKLLPGYSPKDVAALRTLLQNLRTNENAFMLLTPNVDVEFAEVHGNIVDVMNSAEHHNMMILLNVMGQFLNLGVSGQGGGRSTASTQADLFMKSLKYIANYIADVFNMYLIPQLVVWNYPTKNFPKVRVRNIGETKDLQALASALSNLIAQGGLSVDDATEQWLRDLFDMPNYDPASPKRDTGPAANQATEPTPVGGLKEGGVQNGKPQKGDVKQGKSTGNIPPRPIGTS
jgi:hypothetical protein